MEGKAGLGLVGSRLPLTPARRTSALRVPTLPHRSPGQKCPHLQPALCWEAESPAHQPHQDRVEGSELKATPLWKGKAWGNPQR